MTESDRLHSPLPPEVWDALDETAVEAARARLTTRRFLDIEGPFGLGLTAIEVGDDAPLPGADPEAADMALGQAVGVPIIRRSFALSTRRVAAYLDNNQPIDLSPIEDAAEAVADREEDLVYHGQPAFNLYGLLTHPQRQQLAGGDWADLSRALDDVLAAATKLDDSGFRGPYALALEPALYNGLFRLYPGSDVQQLQHLKSLCTSGIYKAPIQGGALIDPRVGVLIVGQDLRTGYESQDGIHYRLFMTETLVLRIDDPAAVCTISATGDFLRKSTLVKPTAPARK
jgi:uncharacterized linocin/CFP29 family protein